MRTASSQRGVALIVILLLLAVMVSIAASMADRLFSQFRRASSQLDYQQAYWYSLSAEALARAGIEQSYQDSDTVNLSQPWAIEEQTYPLDFGTLRGSLTDGQACLNLNALYAVVQTANSNATPYLVEVLQTLLEYLEVESYQAQAIAESVWEFIDEDTTVNTSSGVEDSYYESMSPAYLTANSLLADASELRAIHQVSAEVMTKLRGHVCALPTSDFRLNINTLDARHSALLAAMLAPSLSVEQAKNVIDNRPYDGWQSVDEFYAESALSSVSADVKSQAKGYLDIDSRYFEMDAELLVNDSRVRVRSLLYSENRETATVIRRRFGGIGERESDRSTESQP